MVRPIWLLAALACRCGEEPEESWDFSQGEACLSCHVGIEQAHGPIDAGECTVCHGGDGTALTQEGAHVAAPADWATIRGTGLPTAPEGYIKDMPPDMLDQIDPDYLRFINPGEIRVLDQTCETCHEGYGDQVARSVMTTNAGHYWPTRYLADMQGQEAIYGSYPATDPDYAGDFGTAAELSVLRPPSDAEIDAALADPDTHAIESLAYDHYLAKNCNHCHAAGYGRNNSRGLYRSTGCSSCHVLYSIEGVYEGGDQAVPHNVPVYPVRHEITTAIPTEQCATCHFQGGRIGLLFRGIREGGFSSTPENADPWMESVYGHTAGYYILDEDTTNDVDETPPDLHYAAGMHCVDCHVGVDVHGDGRIYESSKHQVAIQCEDCHGTAREAITPDGSGVYATATGMPLPQLSTGADGSVILTGLVDGAEHVVPQPAQIMASGGSETMHAAMGADDDGWSHTDDLRCDACHTSYGQQCLGCHVSLDLRLTQVDYQTGLSTTGLTRGSREHYSLDAFLLCQATDGRAQSCNSSQQAQLSVIDERGVLALGETELDENGEPTGGSVGVFRETDTATNVIGWAPFFQHTTAATPRTCEACHRTAGTDDEWDRVKGVYGYGTGEFMLEAPGGGEVDALQFLDEHGNLSAGFAHPNTGPLSAESIERALAVEL